MYAFWLLIVTLPQSERQTVNTFEVNLLTGGHERRPVKVSLCAALQKKNPTKNSY